MNINKFLHNRMYWLYQRVAIIRMSWYINTKQNKKAIDIIWEEFEFWNEKDSKTNNTNE